MKRTLISVAGLFVAASAFAQNLNPTVEVTNAYAREASGIEKPSQLMEVPDSVLRFNLDFEYAVNETPYRGAYEFKPYLVQLRPQARPAREGTLYLRAGAGYAFHPEVTVVYTPVKTKKFHLNLFGDHMSYIGPYHGIALNGEGLYTSDGTSWNGKDLRSTVGADALLNWRSGTLKADLFYRNYSMEKPGCEAMTHRVQGSVRVQNTPGTTKVDYDVNTRLSYLQDAGYFEFHTMSAGMLGARVFGKYFRTTLQVETVSQMEDNAALFHLTLPRYSYNGKRFSFMGGVKLAYMLRWKDTFIPTDAWYIFPDVQASLVIAPEKLVMYAAVTGGNEFATWESFQEQNSFIDEFTWKTDVKTAYVQAALGLRGNIASRFSYDLAGGYSWMGNMWLWGVNAATGIPAVCYGGPIHTAFASVTLGWNNHFLDIKGNLKYVYTINKPTVRTEGVIPFLPQEFKGEGHILYNWGERIKAGVTAEGRSALRSPAGNKIPGYVDIGLHGMFQMTPSVGLWAKVGNLLDQPVQRVPFYSEKGVYFTIGASLNL